MPTFELDFKNKTIDVDEKKIKMQIWDCSGKEGVYISSSY
jgi:GTPase SAR1 family protein